MVSPQSSPSLGEKRWPALAIERWTERRNLFRIGVSSCVPSFDVETAHTPPAAASGRGGRVSVSETESQTRLTTRHQGDSVEIESTKADHLRSVANTNKPENHDYDNDPSDARMGLGCCGVRPSAGDGSLCDGGFNALPAGNGGGDSVGFPGRCSQERGENVEGELGEWGAPAAPLPQGPAVGPWGRPVGAGPRWCGNIGPSLFMTAVERREQQERGRQEMERIGRSNLRALGLTAEERARNDLPPRQGLREALGAPAGRFRDLLVQGLREAAEHGNRAERSEAGARLRALAADGLDPGAKSAHPPDSHGWKGLTTAGRRAIRDAGAVMDDQRGTLGFWTVTLPDEAAAVATREQVATFQTRLLFFARRMMLRRGVPPLALVVCEMHPHRRGLGGERIPHWHAIVRVSRAPFQRWAVSVADWHRVVDQAHRAAFGRGRGHSKGCRMLPQKTGAARYLAPYMAKDRSRVEELQGTPAGRMVPRQWWTWTGELRDQVRACRLKPPAPFLRWCCRWWRELEEAGDLASTEQIQIGEEGPIVGRWFVWSSEAALDRAIEAWIGEELARLDCLSSG